MLHQFSHNRAAGKSLDSKNSRMMRRDGSSNPSRRYGASETPAELVSAFLSKFRGLSPKLTQYLTSLQWLARSGGGTAILAKLAQNGHIGSHGINNTLPMPPFSTAACPSLALLNGNFRPMGMTNFLSTTARAISVSALASGLE